MSQNPKETALPQQNAESESLQLFGPETGHVCVVYGVYSLPVHTPVVVETIFEL